MQNELLILVYLWCFNQTRMIWLFHLLQPPALWQINYCRDVIFVNRAKTSVLITRGYISLGGGWSFSKRIPLANLFCWKIPFEFISRPLPSEFILCQGYYHHPFNPLLICLHLWIMIIAFWKKENWFPAKLEHGIPGRWSLVSEEKLEVNF